LILARNSTFYLDFLWFLYQYISTLENVIFNHHSESVRGEVVGHERSWRNFSNEKFAFCSSEEGTESAEVDGVINIVRSSEPLLA